MTSPSWARTLFAFGLSVRNGALYVDRGPDGAFRTPSSLDFSLPTPGLRAVAELALAAAQERGTSPADIDFHLRRPVTTEVVEQVLYATFKIFERIMDLGLKEEEVKRLIYKIMGDQKS